MKPELYKQWIKNEQVGVAVDDILATAALRSCFRKFLKVLFCLFSVFSPHFSKKKDEFCRRHFGFLARYSELQNSWGSSTQQRRVSSV
jgi:hypothetical protein